MTTAVKQMIRCKTFLYIGLKNENEFTKNQLQLRNQEKLLSFQ